MKFKPYEYGWYGFLEDLYEWFITDNLIEIIKSFTLIITIFVVVIQFKYFIDLIYLYSHSVIYKKEHTEKLDTEEYKMSKSRRYVNYCNAMSKMEAMKEKVADYIRNEHYTKEDLNLYETLTHLLEYKIKRKQDYDDVVWLFNNGKFRSQKELEDFNKKKEQEKYLEEQLNDEVFLIVQEQNLNTRLHNDLIINPILGQPFLNPVGYFIGLINTFVNFFFFIKKPMYGFDLHLYTEILDYNFNYLLVYLGCFFISYFIEGGLDIASEIKTTKKLKDIYTKAGLKAPFNKNLAIKSGLYAFNIAALLKKKKK